MAASQETQVRSSEVQVDTLDTLLAPTAQSLQDDLNYGRSLLRLIIDPAAPWYSTPATSLAALDALTSGMSTDLSGHLADATVHFTEASIDHENILNKGVNTHAQLDAHVASSANPHGITPADIGAAVVVHTHTSSEITDFDASVDSIIAVNSLVAANTAKVSADGSLDTHSDVSISGGNVPSTGDVLYWDGANFVPTTPGSGAAVPLGDVSGPGAGNATDKAIARWDTASGQLLQDSDVLLQDHISGLAIIKGGVGIELALESDAGYPLRLHNADDSSTALTVEPGSAGRVTITPHGDILLASDAGAIEIMPGAAKTVRIYHGDGSKALTFADAAGGRTVLFDTMRPEAANNVSLGDLDAGGRWENVLSEKFTLEEGVSTPAPVGGMTQLFMGATNHVSAIKSNGTIVDLELGSGGGGTGLQLAHQSYTPTASQTLFSLAQAPAGQAIVFLNGIEYTENVDFTVVGALLTWNAVATGIVLDPEDDFDIYYEV